MNNTAYTQNITVQYCFPYINSSCRKEVRTGPGNILLFIFLSCVSVCTVFLNLLVIISISHFKQLHTPTNLLILSLAVADLLVGLFVMPVNIMMLIDSCWYLGKIMCSIYPIFNGISMSGSIYSLILIAVDRFIAVTDPLLYSTRVTVCKTLLLIILGWSFSLLYAFIFLYFNDHLLPSQALTGCYGECVIYVKYSWLVGNIAIFFLAPCSVILILYSIIFKVARRQAKAVRAVTRVASNKHGPKVSRSSEAKAAKTLGIVIFVHLACWIPYSLSVEKITSLSVVWTVFAWIIYMNSSMNPLIYAILYPWFRASVKYIITCRMFVHLS
ncbi:trace amine-associated receptor 13c-like [Colossoma macropomum]|uniref:trace amine-associated receptor 13c-like n=1 Tax=Colossoma macropomum TaxID=42526 RepID=UPI00186527B3|nr:trace amine-associated receptor 13c-like [Colossoma macropomum]